MKLIVNLRLIRVVAVTSSPHLSTSSAREEWSSQDYVQSAIVGTYRITTCTTPVEDAAAAENVTLGC